MSYLLPFLYGFSATVCFAALALAARAFLTRAKDYYSAEEKDV